MPIAIRYTAKCDSCNRESLIYRPEKHDVEEQAIVTGWRIKKPLIGRAITTCPVCVDFEVALAKKADRRRQYLK